MYYSRYGSDVPVDVFGGISKAISDVLGAITGKKEEERQELPPRATPTEDKYDKYIIVAIIIVSLIAITGAATKGG
jgi:uncharacterized membrane protein YgcG